MADGPRKGKTYGRSQVEGVSGTASRFPNPRDMQTGGGLPSRRHKVETPEGPFGGLHPVAPRVSASGRLAAAPESGLDGCERDSGAVDDVVWRMLGRYRRRARLVLKA